MSRNTKAAPEPSNPTSVSTQRLSPARAANKSAAKAKATAPPPAPSPPPSPQQRQGRERHADARTSAAGARLGVLLLLLLLYCANAFAEDKSARRHAAPRAPRPYLIPQHTRQQAHLTAHAHAGTRPSTLIAMGRGTTGTHTMFEALCLLGHPSVHYSMACVPSSAGWWSSRGPLTPFALRL